MLSGRYDQALDWAERTLREDPGYTGALRSKAVACAHLDRIEAACEAVHQWIEFQPWQTIARTRRTLLRWYSPEISPQITEMYIEGLRKAGMPEE